MENPGDGGFKFPPWRGYGYFLEPHIFFIHNPLFCFSRLEISLDIIVTPSFMPHARQSSGDIYIYIFTNSRTKIMNEVQSHILSTTKLHVRRSLHGTNQRQTHPIKGALKAAKI